MYTQALVGCFHEQPSLGKPIQARKGFDSATAHILNFPSNMLRPKAGWRQNNAFCLHAKDGHAVVDGGSVTNVEGIFPEPITECKTTGWGWCA